jgi:hypothetical protein
MDLEENFTCWKKCKDGSFAPSGSPYTRRKFRTPKKPDPNVLEWMLQKEDSVQNTNKNKFKNLCQEIDTLGESLVRVCLTDIIRIKVVHIRTIK